MLLIQQSPTFRIWTSRTLMLYFRRTLLFLVVNSRQKLNKDKHDTKVDEYKLLEKSLCVQNRNHSNLLQISQSKYDLLKEYSSKRLYPGFNNSMKSYSSNESIDETSSAIISTNLSSYHQMFVGKKFKMATPHSLHCCRLVTLEAMDNTNVHKNKNKLNNSTDQYQAIDLFSSYQSIPMNNQNQINSCPSYHSPVNCKNSAPLSSHYGSRSSLLSISDLSDDEISLSNENLSVPIEEKLSQVFDDANDIYEKYQTSFSHILHHTKSLHTIREEDKLYSMLALEPHTSIITVCQLTRSCMNSHDTIHHAILTSYICVRLIAERTDLAIESDKKSMKCKRNFTWFPMKQTEKPVMNSIIKSTTIDNEQQSSIFINKNFEAISIMIDTPCKIIHMH
ncbi:unnamed protein product [Rotaria magnacalcarata]|uniref:Uncharacterized protein n=2 Tax=Rotaria magnacalcarata TaxID=392030 RepID=A0A820F1E4_9BILA|nr:unnamed protein product [Rotaria magnacalcarata]